MTNGGKKMEDNRNGAEHDTQLQDEDIRKIAQEETSVKSPDGKTVRLADLISAGLDNDQAIGALGLVALGAGVGTAVTAATTETASAQASTGSGTLSIGELIANQVASGTVDADEITGDVVGRTDPIDHLAGNQFVDTDEPSSGTVDDLLFQLGGSQ